jgi:hypothetical protein
MANTRVKESLITKTENSPTTVAGKEDSATDKERNMIYLA